MVFQHCGYETAGWNPINLGHGGNGGCGAVASGCASKKRKAVFEAEAGWAGSDAMAPRPKLSLPRSAGLVLNEEARFHPLPDDENATLLAQLGRDPFAVRATASAGFGHAHQPSDGSDYFAAHATVYPDVAPYPASPTRACGILGPAPAAPPHDAMLVDTAAEPPSHGPHCKSIPQLYVRYNDNTASELWATCRDCGTTSKVDSSQPASRLCYSP